MKQLIASGYALLLTMILVVAVAPPATAQIETARITGIIRDSTGAVVPGATVTFVHVATNTTTTATSNEVGRYISIPLRIGEYRLEVQADAFKKAVRSGVILEIDETAVVDFNLELGQVTEVVDVTADAPLLDTTQATQGQVIDNNRILEMPLNGRNYIQLALLSQGAVQPVGGRFGGFSAGGNRTTQNNYTLDGVDNNNVQIAAQGRQAEAVRPPIDAIQEFKVSVNSFSAEHGRAAGGVVTVSTKAGSNELHGSAYEFLRNEKLDAKNLFDDPDTPKPPFKRNQFGFAAGGPIVKNKLFIFGDYEWTRIRESRTVTTTIPTTRMRTGDFAELSETIYDPYSYDPATKTRNPFPGNIVPSAAIDPISTQIVDWYPEPTASGLVSNFNWNPPNSSDIDKWDIRTDYNVNADNTLYFRFSYQRQYDPESPNLPAPAWGTGANATPFEHNGRNMGLVWNHIWNPSVITSSRIGWNMMDTDRLPPIDYSVNAQLGIKGVNQTLTGAGVFNISGYQNVGISAFTPNLATSQTRQLVSDTTWVRGMHSVKFGVNFSWLQSYLSNPQQELGVFFFNGNYTRNPANNKGGDGMADFLTGVMYRGDTSTSVYMNLRAPFWQSYIQDQWRVSSRLTLNLGVRFENNQNWVEKDDLFSMYDIETDPANPQWVFPQETGERFDRALIRDDWKLVPRSGFAYEMRPGSVLRGGYGMYVANYEGTGGGQYLETNPPFHMKVRMSTDSRTVTLRLQDGMPPGILTPERARSLSFSTFERRPTLPVSQQWNFNIQQQLGRDWVWEIGYYGNKTQHLVRRWDGNFAPPGPGNIDSRRHYTQAYWPNTDIVIGPLGSFNSHFFNGNNLFHSLQTRVEKRFTNGFTVLGSFMWAKAIGDTNGFSGSGNTANSGVQDPRNLKAERSLADQHIGKRFVASYIYELPFGRGKKWGNGWGGAVNTALGGWAIAGITTITSGEPRGLSVKGNPSNASTFTRPNVVHGEDWKLPSDERSTERWFNTNAFVAPPQYTFGNAARNVVLGPGRTNFDLALYKRFRFTERFSLQFRLEAFNAFNTPPWADPNMELGNKNFGRITGAGRPRNLQFGLKLIW